MAQEAAEQGRGTAAGVLLVVVVPEAVVVVVVMGTEEHHWVAGPPHQVGGNLPPELSAGCPPPSHTAAQSGACEPAVRPVAQRHRTDGVGQHACTWEQQGPRWRRVVEVEVEVEKGQWELEGEHDDPAVA